MKQLLLFLLVSGTLPILVQSQNIGIGTNTPTAQLHTTGSVRHAALNGVGIRPVFVDANGNLLVTVPALPPSSVTNTIAQSIPDISCTGVTSINTLSGLPTSVQSISISVTINITHTKVADLSIYLTAPNGSIINLLSPTTGESGANFTNTVFADGGALLTSATSPYTGQFKPSADMNPSICGITPTAASFGAIGGGAINPNGNWTLRVIDNTTGNTGTLKSWTVSVTSGLGIDGLWGLKGNSGTNAFNFIGTTDRTPLRFKVNNALVGLIDTADNIFFGSGGQNNKGTANTGIGAAALALNNTGEKNTGIGFAALLFNDTGKSNTAVGDEAMLFNHFGNLNTALGKNALYNNSSGNNNTAIGDSALYTNQTGINNVAIGSNALFASDGSNNIAIGRNAQVSGNFNNAIALGYNAIVDAPDKVRIGNTTVKVIEGQVPFSSPSDGRFKTNVTETVRGLNFIMRLRPVIYNFQTRKYEAFLRGDIPNNSLFAKQDFSESESIRQSGFVAQEVEKAATEAGYDFNGINAPKNGKQTYSLSYAQFVVPLVKAVQEQQAIIENMKTQLAIVQKEISELKKKR